MNENEKPNVNSQTENTAKNQAGEKFSAEEKEILNTIAEIIAEMVKNKNYEK